LHLKNYGELITSSVDGKLPLLPPRPDANLAQGYGPIGMKNLYRKALMNLLGVKYIVQHDEGIQDGNSDTNIFPEDNYLLVWSQSPWQIYENKQVLPRYFLVNSFTLAKGQKALDTLYTADLATTVILNAQPQQKVDANATGHVQLLSYNTQSIDFTTNTTGPMILFLSDTYFPSWKAKVDGKETPIFLADYAFRGLVVPKGMHTVHMYYKPQYFMIGLIIAGVSFVVFLLSLLVLKKYEK